MPLSNTPPIHQAKNRRLVLVEPESIQERAAPQTDWSALMASAQDGDRNAYRALLTQIEPYVRSIARRCFRHPAIANHRVIDRLRHETRKRAREIELSPEHETFAQAHANHDGIAERALIEAIDKLPPEQRDAVRMLKLNEMSLKEASKASGRSVAALKVATHRALANLRKLIGGGSGS